MRINQFVAQATGLSRRKADTVIAAGSVMINGDRAQLGDTVSDTDKVTYKGKHLIIKATLTVMLNKPVGYVCSRDGQGSKTIYDLLPPELHRLKPAGRLDKESSGLLLLTNDGNLAHNLTHPSKQKEKVYEVTLEQTLNERDKQKIEQGVMLEDGISALKLNGSGNNWVITLSEGRNRQIRRTFASLGYGVTKLHRTSFGSYELGQIDTAKYETVK